VSRPPQPPRQAPKREQSSRGGGFEDDRARWRNLLKPSRVGALCRLPKSFGTAAVSLPQRCFVTSPEKGSWDAFTGVGKKSFACPVAKFAGAAIQWGALAKPFDVGRLCVRLLSCNRPNAVAFDHYSCVRLLRRTGAIYHVYILLAR
jgi:hypothetical protein